MARSEQDLIRPGDQADPADTDRVRTLLASVRDLTSSLQRLTAQLERELVALPDGPFDDATAAVLPERAAAELDRLQGELEQLRAAQRHRAVIEQAKGMLMAGRRCSDDEAFALLVGMSQAEQRKVREIASELVAAALQAPAEPEPAAARQRAEDPAPTPAAVRPRRIDLDLAGDGSFPVGRQARPR